MAPLPSSLPAGSDTELSLSVERAYREVVVVDRLGALWSLILAKCFLAQWAIDKFVMPISGLRYIWSLTLAMGVVATVLYLRAHRAQFALFPHQFRVSSAILGGLLIAQGFLLYAHFALGHLPAAGAAGLAAAMFGAWSLARASLKRAHEPLVGALLWWGLAATALTGANIDALLWIGLGFLFAQALPCFALARRLERSARV
jgi:hypothetical protein